MRYLMLLSFVVLAACSHEKCKNHSDPNASSTAATAGAAAGATAASSGGTKTMAVPSSPADHVKVYKADGSLQCGQGKAIKPDDMAKDLKDIKVFSSYNKNDGMMRIQLCGSPTGNCNVYEISRADLDAALKLGFKEWIGE
jgi:hypothetical protein